MRLKLKMQDSDSYTEVLNLLNRECIEIFINLPKRNLMVVDRLPFAVRRQINEMGGSVTPEKKYVPESLNILRII